jgi:hypothetical protein
MNRVEFDQEKADLEKYFLDVIKNKFKHFCVSNFSYTLRVEYQSELDINGILKVDGFTVYGMCINKYEFTLQLEFDHEYTTIEEFPFDRLDIIISNDSGDYNIFFNENSFNQPWQAELIDNYHRYLRTTQNEFQTLKNVIKNTHLHRVLRLT